MKPIIVFVSLLMCASIVQAQTANATWSNEFKMRKGSTDLSVVNADETGLFVKEGHLALKSYFVIGASTRESATLIKLDKSFNEEYRNDFNKELKGKDFEDFFFIRKKAYLLASVYHKKERGLEFFACEIDKSNGELTGDWKSLSTITKDEKSDQLYVNFAYNADSSKMIMVSTNRGKEKSSFDIEEFDSKMNNTGKVIHITNAYEPKTFQLEDVIYTTNGNIVMVGRVYDFAEGKKKKSKFLEFLNYNIQLYNNEGSLIKEINTEVNGKWLISSKAAQIPDKDLVIAAFYSNSKKAKEINGMMVQRVDANTGDIISTSQKELNTALIDNVSNDDENNDDESKQDRKEREKLDKIKDDEEGFSKYMRFKNFVYTDDNGIVILAEKYHHYSYTTMNSSSMPGGFANTSTTTYQVYECGDIMMSKIDAAGQISWLHVLPKSQREVIQSGSFSGSDGIGFSMGTDYFRGFNFPFYAGLGSVALADKNMLAILYNDNPKNETVLQLGQKVHRAQRFGKTECVAVYLDVSTGKYTRKGLFNNEDQPTAMPRFGKAVGKDYFVVGKDDKLLGKSRIAICKITFK